MSNLYHSIEYLQNDFLQRGQYVKAHKVLLRLNLIISKLGGVLNWEKTKSLVWIQHRMYTRQLVESFGVGPSTDPFGCNAEKKNLETLNNLENLNFKNLKTLHKCTDGFVGSLVSEPLEDGTMNYAAISELGMLLLHVFHGVQVCAKDKISSCPSNLLLNWAVKQSEKLINDLESRKSLHEYTKHMAQMLHHVMLGLIDLAENIRPHGLTCYTQKKCKADIEKFSDIVSKVVNGPLKRATEIQKKLMIQSSATVTLLYMPSYEIYGHVLLFFDKYAEAKEMFETSLQERMGRAVSLLGLARAHAMLGNKQQADYFYKYLRKQLRQADKNNPMVKEAKRWSKSSSQAEKLRNRWFFPYFLKRPQKS